VIFYDFPGPGIFRKNIQDFPGGVVTLQMTGISEKFRISGRRHRQHRSWVVRSQATAKGELATASLSPRIRHWCMTPDYA